ncbi:energy-coupling factor ABC transporter ATP-binding protein [Aurantimonas sp. VKM B-3413]|uniref:energy-coupling factor ABC transporter ATP-binding protein n=1 Tax=Aurantimonas sp. VKM B-3413 TaxID=2779401 RepID=UPI001E397AE0|nr:ABC transporter ATP-binding protein [Aurantimonas sp. VKM B-3413]MCB8837667.1 energy-coupling factor ABC transporter ATP-binding protein [Aurantimonas sp. VKM B-3413]
MRPVAADGAPGRGIELRGVSVVRGGRTVLAGIALTLAERRIGIIGANGSGKSTFARLLNGLILPADGAVTVDGLDTRRQAKAVRRRVGFLFQNPDNQIVYPTVGEDLAFGLKGRVPKAEIPRLVSDTLARFGIPGFADRLVHELSGGERQMVALAGVMIAEPAWLVLDEPTTLLDLRNTRRVMSAVGSLDQQVVLVTHDLSLLQDFDRVLVFEEGRLAFDGPPDAAISAYLRIIG